MGSYGGGHHGRFHGGGVAIIFLILILLILGTGVGRGFYDA